jgi:hypothetical protein
MGQLLGRCPGSWVVLAGGDGLLSALEQGLGVAAPAVRNNSVRSVLSSLRL